MKKTKRYFIVMYSVTVLGGTGTGMVSFVTNGTFISMKGTIKEILKLNPRAIDAIITNIIEITEKDYETWKFEE